MKDIVKLIGKELAKSDELVNSNREQEYKINFLIGGEVVVKRGHDYKQVISFSLPYDKMIAVLLSKLNGVTIDSVVREALESDLDTSDIKAKASEALKSIKGLGERNCSGKITLPHVEVLSSDVDVCEYC